MSNVFSLRDDLKLSLEKIRMQDGSLFKELSETIEGLMQISIVDQNDINQSALSRVVKKHTGMEVTFTLVPQTFDAYAHLVEIDKNHPFFHQRDALIPYVTNNYKTTKTEAIGSVNLKNGTVDGVFSKYPVKIGLGSLFITGYMNDPKYDFTADEVAAILIHEIGHCFTTFEYVGKTVMTGLVISSAVKESVGIKDPGQRTKLIMKASNDVNLQISETVAEETLRKYGENADVVLLSMYVKQLNTLTKTNYYDARNCEQIADQFAVQHGAASSLGRALEKLYKLGFDINYMKTPTFVILEVIKVAFVMFAALASLTGGGLVGGFLFAVTMLMFSPGAKIYDDPKDRLEFMKRQLIDDLKQLNLQDKKNTELIKTITDHIDDLDKLISEVKDRRTFMTTIWDTVTPWGRNREQQEAKQKLLEQALNNDLFAKAAKISQL